MLSLRIRLLFGSLLVTTICVIASGVAIYLLVRQGLYTEFQDELREKAVLLATMVDVDERGLSVHYPDEDVSEFSDSENPSYFQFWRENGGTISRSASLSDEDLLPQHDWNSRVELPNGTRGCQVRHRFRPPICAEGDDPPPGLANAFEDSVDGRIDEVVTIAVAAPTTHIDAILLRLVFVLAIVVSCAVGLSPFMMLLVVRQGLHPLTEIADDIRKIDEDTLSQRIDREPVPEIQPIVERINGLLARVERIVQRERAFSSDVAHELRTPLCGISSTIEVCLAKSRDTSRYTKDLSTCQKICKQSQRMVECLLELAVLESGKAEVNLQPVDLAELLVDCWQEFEHIAVARNVSLERLPLDKCNLLIHSDEEKVRLVFRNLVQNAVTHCDEGGIVDFDIAMESNIATIIIENSGNSHHSRDVELVFERFWRGEASRTNSGRHFGLGMPLVKKLLGLIDGCIRVSVDGERFRVKVSLPVNPSPCVTKHTLSP